MKKGSKQSKNSKIKMSKSLKTHYKSHSVWNKGKELPQDLKDKISKGSIGKTISKKHLKALVDGLSKINKHHLDLNQKIIKIQIFINYLIIIIKSFIV